MNILIINSGHPLLPYSAFSFDFRTFHFTVVFIQTLYIRQCAWRSIYWQKTLTQEKAVLESRKPLLYFNSFIEICFTSHAIYPFKLHNSVVFSMVTELCNHHHNQFQNIFIIFQRDLVLAITLLIPPTVPTPLGNH